MSINFSDFSSQTFLKDHSSEIQLSEIWKTLLDFLHDEAEQEAENFPWQENLETGSFKIINDNADLKNITFSDLIPSDVITASSIISNSYSNIINIILKNWDAQLWNDSLTNLICNYYFALDAIGISSYEGDSIYINEDGTINTEYTRGIIGIKNSKVKLRFFDVLNGNAGNSFLDEGSLYSLETENLGKRIYKAEEKSLWVIPWYNVDGQTYRTVRADDLKLSVMQLGVEKDIIVNNINNKGKYFLDFTRAYSEDDNKLLRLLMPQYKRKVEVEDLNRNFWVIAQSISAMMAYLFDPEGPYAKIVGNELNEIMQLWENVLFLWAEIAATTKKHPDTIAKIVYISPENLSDYLSYDDFDLVDIVKEYQQINPVLKYTDTERGPAVKVVNSISVLEKNQPFEDVVINYLREYRKKFANKNIIFIPVVRLHNYEHNYFKRIICPGIYRYFLNTEDFQKMVTEKKLPIPNVELINGTFRTDTQMLGDTNPILLNYFYESFQSLTYLDAQRKYYSYDIGMMGLSKVISGICEKEDETGYLGINKLEKSEELKTSSEEKVYGLVKPCIYVESKKTIDYCGAEFVNFYIEAYDLAKYFIQTENKIENNEIKIGEDDYIVYRDWYSDNEILGLTKIDRRQDSEWISNKGELIKTYNIEGNFGYYLGELLSEKRNSSKLNFNVVTLRERFLQPTWIEEEEYKALYGRDSNDNPEILKDVEDDKITLINILKNTYDKWVYKTNTDQFWEERKAILSNIGEIQQWQPNQLCRISYFIKDGIHQPDEQDRRNVKLSNGLNNKKYKWGIPTSDPTTDLTVQDNEWVNRWKQAAWSDLDDLTSTDKEMSEASILFVNGIRNTNWATNDTGEGREGNDCYAKDGLLHHLYDTTAGNTVQAGAAVRIPIGGGDAGYGFYPLHTSPTSSDWEPWGTGLPPVQIGRQNILDANGQIASIPKDGTMLNDNGEIIYYRYNDPTCSREAEELYKNYRNKSIYVKKDENIIPRFLPTSGAPGRAKSQYSVLKKTAETDFTEENWLITKIDQFYNVSTVYYEFSFNDEIKLSNLEKPFSEIDNVKVGNAIGTLDCIHEISPLLEMYYKHTYQKYVYSIVSEWSDQKKLNTSLENIYNELDLRHKLFGWLRIMDLEGNIIRTIKYPYNSPFSYNLDNENFIDNLLRKEKMSIAGCIKNGITQEGSDIKKEDLEILLNIFGIDQTISNCYYMGNFANLYSGSTFTDDPTEKTYYEDRIMGNIRGLQEINQLDLIYKNNEKRADLLEMVQYQFNVFKDKWYSGDKIEMYRKIAKWITPQDNPPVDLSNYSITLTLPIADDSQNNFIKINDKLCFTADYCYRINIYTFGPESLQNNYARRGISRYPFNCYLNDGDDEEKTRRAQIIAMLDESNLGKWPIRPLNMQINTEPNWKDDYEITNIDIDTLRDGYSVISTTITNNNFEKYKTRQNEEVETYYHTTFGGMEGDDDNDFDNIWENN